MFHVIEDEDKYLSPFKLTKIQGNLNTEHI